MCDVTLALTAASTVMQGMAAKQQGKYEQGVEEYNARLAENEAQKERNRATEAENVQRRKTAELVSKQRAQLAAQGVELGSGSALSLVEDTETLGEMDALRIRESGEDAFQAKQSEASLRRHKGAAAAQAGQNAFTGSLITAGAGVIGHGVSNKWFTPKSAANTAELNNIAMGT